MKRKILIILLSVLSACSQQTGNITVQPSVKPSLSNPIPINNDSVINTTSSIPVNVSPSLISASTQPVKTKEPYSRVDTIPEGLSTGKIELTFKDEFKIRYLREERKYISLAGADVKSLNKILLSDKYFYRYVPNISEEQAESQDNSLSKDCECDARNPLSTQIIDILPYQESGFKQEYLDEIINNLRHNQLVREANLSIGVIPDYLNPVEGSKEPGMKPKIPYSKVEPIPENKTDGSISLTFKDEYKIRYNKIENKFISLVGTDVTSLNKILISDYETFGFQEPVISEEKAETFEKRASEICECDYSNHLSIQEFILQKGNLKKFITELRNNQLVREANDAYKYVFTPASDQELEGDIQIRFKEDYKIRYSPKDKMFISLIGVDVSDINEILFSIYDTYNFFDYPPCLLSFRVRGVPLREIIDALKASKLVRYVDIDQGCITGAGG